MESNAFDRPTIEKYLATVRERLRALGVLLETGNGKADAIRAAVASTVGAVDDVQSCITDPREATRVACPFCGTRVMLDATLCLSCWHHLVRPAAS